jgi:pilus assembly protein Flp/PilA
VSEMIRLFDKIRKDEEGATLVEYTMLLAIIVVAVITTLGKVGNWVNAKWTAFCTSLTGC